MHVLVGKSASDNDILTFKLASPQDFWMHVTGEPGSHVVVRNPDALSTLPRETLRYAAALAARFSRAGSGGKVTVHVARAGDVRKLRGESPGKVFLKKYKSVKIKPLRAEET